ncbi:MAG: alpha/beta fold hydrolase [Syntrophaceae bacterium]|nr:alpha/beta fold hydrolase [Syntrophaceae bacterium]
MVRPDWLNKLYPFKSNFFQLKDNLSLHYLDEGKGDPMLMLHGNPTWSFYYRNLVAEFSNSHRVVVPDHIGCGLSGKPQDYEYTLKQHIDNLEKFVSFLKLKDFILVVHDWGGAIGFGLLERHPDLVNKIVILNTAAYLSDVIAFQINICRIPVLAEQVIRRLNGFALTATYMAVAKKMSPEIRKGYLFPYDNYKNRIATARFVADIPMNPRHRSYQTLKNIELSLAQHHCPILILWGKKDFCFHDHFLNRWREIYPHAIVKTFKNAGHYVLEDAKDEIIQELKQFL